MTRKSCLEGHRERYFVPHLKWSGCTGSHSAAECTHFHPSISAQDTNGFNGGTMSSVISSSSSLIVDLLCGQSLALAIMARLFHQCPAWCTYSWYHWAVCLSALLGRSAAMGCDRVGTQNTFAIVYEIFWMRNKVAQTHTPLISERISVRQYKSGCKYVRSVICAGAYE